VRFAQHRVERAERRGGENAPSWLKASSFTGAARRKNPAPVRWRSRKARGVRSTFHGGRDQLVLALAAASSQCCTSSRTLVRSGSTPMSVRIRGEALFHRGVHAISGRRRAADTRHPPA